MHSRQEFLGRKFDPALACVGDDDHFGLLEASFQEIDYSIFNCAQMACVLFEQVIIVAFINWMEVSCWEKGVIPIKDNQILVLFGLLKRSKPNLLMGESLQELNSRICWVCLMIHWPKLKGKLFA